MEKNVLHTDATYKLNFIGYPLLVFETTDGHCSFHVIGLGISYSETGEDFAFCFKAIKGTAFRVLGTEVKFDTVVSDAATAIHNGVDAVYPNRDKITCFFHVKKQVEAFSKFKNKENIDAIIHDIDQIHLCPSDKAFEDAIKL